MEITKEIISNLLDGRLADSDVEQLQRMHEKDADRFWKYLEVLQERVQWNDKILLRLTDHLYIVRNGNGARVVKCDCGHEFGDYRVNWKIASRVRVRRTAEEFKEVYTPDQAIPEPGWMTIREYFCPGCAAQLAVEVVPPGYPPIFDLLPDLDRLYRELGRPLEDESEDWFRDRTMDVVANFRR
ncbi:acetone carboxylase subunit gamma [Kyrpidia spormannii]|uniref:Acetone carboxylase subunit gamma n=1 Tax=Kyrpidia spormannii TaxID=2055160 RepID=A0A2K8N5E6_9BACL|nr:acetone carboxylase subunit gamma [Kyrpidia spormannii]ATY84543.1 acetone carboxylase subunit gamma [Kyrpidia spormannii]